MGQALTELESFDDAISELKIGANASYKATVITIHTALM